MAIFRNLEPTHFYDIIDGETGFARTCGISGLSAFQVVWFVGDEAWRAGETEFQGTPLDIAVELDARHSPFERRCAVA